MFSFQLRIIDDLPTTYADYTHICEHTILAYHTYTRQNKTDT